MERLLKRLKSPVPEARDVRRYRVPARLAYVVSHSFPFSSDGYAVRTHGVASTLVRLGYSVIAINRPGNPWDLPGFPGDVSVLQKNIEGVRYLYLRNPSRKRLGPAYLSAAADALKEYLRIFKPGAVMAASDWENALPAAVAAKELGLPFFYEVRGFWEISLASRKPQMKDSVHFRQALRMETEVAQAADRIFTLNGFMREELVRRGVEAGAISLLPNGIGYALPARPKRQGRAGTGDRGPFVVGYIGSFSEYEGLEDLVEACARIRKEGAAVLLLLVGSSSPAGMIAPGKDCAMSRSLRRLAEALDFSEFLELPGRIRPEEVADYYARLDLVVIPRKPLPVCQIVSPLKPLEAAAYGKPILMSDVGPLQEMAREANVDATYRAGDVTDLANRIREYVADRGKLENLGDAYLKWVSTRRTWSRVIADFTRKYPAAKRPEARAPGSTPGAGSPKGGRIAFLPFGNPAPGERRRLRVASILDAFSHACFAPICDLVPITPRNWARQTAGRKIDMLLVESAWHGNDDAWLYRIAKYGSPPGDELGDVLRWAGRAGVPTVFWNKEDPPNFDRFVECAARFDYIFTTDEDCIERYRAHTSPGRFVGVLPFAAQPAIHNLHRDAPRLPATSFAGTYYADDFSARREAMDMLLRAARRHGLDIYDRMSHLTGKGRERYAFPEDLQPHVRGSLSYDEVVRAYRRYRVALNVNSVSDSPTMFSRRVFELLACGTPVVSTYSKGIASVFGGVVPTVATAQEADGALQALMQDPLHWLQCSVRGMRAVFEKHTYAHRLRQIAGAAGLDAGVRPLRDIVMVLFPGGDAGSFLDVVQSQRLRPAGIVIAGSEFADANVGRHLQAVRSSGIRADALPKENIAAYLRDLYPESGAALCSGQHTYGPSYLLDASISISGDPLVRASTMHPKEDGRGYLSKLEFHDVENYGMDVTSVFPGTLVARADSPVLGDVLTKDPGRYADVSAPVMNRPWVGFVQGTDAPDPCGIATI